MIAFRSCLPRPHPSCSSTSNHHSILRPALSSLSLQSQSLAIVVESHHRLILTSVSVCVCLCASAPAGSASGYLLLSPRTVCRGQGSCSFQPEYPLGSLSTATTNTTPLEGSIVACLPSALAYRLRSSAHRRRIEVPYQKPPGRLTTSAATPLSDEYSNKFSSAGQAAVSLREAEERRAEECIDVVAIRCVRIPICLV